MKLRKIPYRLFGAVAVMNLIGTLRVRTPLFPTFPLVYIEPVPTPK